MLLNRAMDKDWTQQGIYVSFNRDLADARGWSTPAQLPVMLRTNQWYPQVVGLDRARHDTDKSAGRRARLFVRGESCWEIEFLRPGDRR